MAPVLAYARSSRHLDRRHRSRDRLAAVWIDEEVDLTPGCEDTRIGERRDHSSGDLWDAIASAALVKARAHREVVAPRWSDPLDDLGQERLRAVVDEARTDLRRCRGRDICAPAVEGRHGFSRETGSRLEYPRIDTAAERPNEVRPSGQVRQTLRGVDLIEFVGGDLDPTREVEAIFESLARPVAG